jgi:hypothetical protein
MLLGPVAVGGVGGSGTRVVARILQVLGGYMGANLNDSLDNLWFTLLMKRPALKTKTRIYEEDPAQTLAVFARAMTQGIRGAPSVWEREIIDAAFSENLGDITSFEIDSLINSKAPDHHHRFWGFKEPCAAMWVEEMVYSFADLRYIHVIRDARDMCLSLTMKSSMRHWGSLYGSNGSVTMESLVRFWSRVNGEAIDAGSLLDDRFLPISFEDLCENPRENVERIARLIGLEFQPGQITEAAAIVKKPPSIGRGAQLEVTSWA